MSVHFNRNISEVFEFDNTDDYLEDDVFEMGTVPSLPKQRVSLKRMISRSKHPPSAWFLDKISAV